MPVRAATQDDCAAIARLNGIVQDIHAAALPDLFKPVPAGACPSAAILEMMREDGAFMGLAEVDGTCAGYVYARIVRRPETAFRYAVVMVYVHHISVQPAFRGQGIGRELVAFVISRARRENIRTVAADVWSFNHAAKSFFERCGLSVFNERMSAGV
ncbi:MAG: GNAT family N-acetyltransferase [Alphaproteobacteria bacterium]|nr:GNAT family N-acetyltransferase [Alphaproteobacteria bacterium]